MKKLMLLLGLILLLNSVDATKIVFQDNTHSHILRCCNATICLEARDIPPTYIQNDTYIWEFNIIDFNSSDIISCYEVGNTLDINITNFVLSFPQMVAVLIFGGLIIIFIVYLLARSLKGKK